MSQERSSWSFKVGTVAGIPIRIHISFILLLAWLVFGTEASPPIRETIFVLLVFFCVLLHELGHALTAKRFGVNTRSITLYPFGGIAAIVSQPSPRAELIISLAGPAINLIISAILFSYIDYTEISRPEAINQSLISRLFLANIALAIFNLLPALPMDGGRVLRAGLTLAGVNNATQIAARISQVLCIALAILALYWEQPILFIISLLIFLGAMQEHVRAKTRAIAAPFSVADVMIARDKLVSLPHGTTISGALKIALTSWQPVFPILSGDVLQGLISRESLLDQALVHDDSYIGELINRGIPAIDLSNSLPDAISQMEQSGNHILTVTKDGQYVGILTYDKLCDFLLMHEIKQHNPKSEDIDWGSPL